MAKRIGIRKITWRIWRNISDWVWSHSPASHRTVMDDYDRVYSRIHQLEKRLAPVEAWVDEQLIRGKVRELFDTPSGQAWLDQWFGEQP